ncbi:MAG: DUF362 domain-containing protein [Oscillospiraceae bacterium]|jgi:uncharacterized Fe-S center protein|nr:DUF362 domain-containing protein [Oscillospiraceae bacterium]
MSTVKFSSMAFSRWDQSETLPAKFRRLLEGSGLAEKIGGKSVAIKMHVGAGTSFSTIPPVFIRILVDYVKKSGSRCFITDHYIHGRHPEERGYTASNLGCEVLEGAGFFGKYFYTREVDFKKLRHIDVSGLIGDAEFLINFSHVKGHGACAFGGAVKNIAMGCVTDRTRGEIHSLEGGIKWDKDKCTRCEQCLQSCNHHANKFENGEYQMFYHHCTFCQHCVKVCPAEALVVTDQNNEDFNEGMAICTKEVLDTFNPGNHYHINVLTSITALCDCWGMTTPDLVPDIGIMASDDIVALEKASMDAIKFENLIETGVPKGHRMGNVGHLFQRLHGKDPYAQLEKLVKYGLGSTDYEIEPAE